LTAALTPAYVLLVRAARRVCGAAAGDAAAARGQGGQEAVEAVELAALQQRRSGHAEADRWGLLLLPLPLQASAAAAAAAAAAAGAACFKVPADFCSGESGSC
jgi:hypothetical protein